MSIHAFADSRRHDVYDISVGSILGSMVAFFSYRRHYPRLRSPRCGELFPSREASFSAGFAKIKDDEDTVGAFDLEDREGSDSD